jgi:hypothetical protein
MTLEAFLIRNTQYAIRWFTALLWASFGIFSAGLGFFILTGTTARYIQDDYCFSVILSRKNIVEIYLHETTFSGNRFMLVLTTALSEQFGAWSVQALPGILIVLWVVGLTLALRQGSRLFFSAARTVKPAWIWLLSALSAELWVLLTLYTASDRIQILYWRAGSLTYLAPLVVFPYLLTLMFWHIQRPRTSWGALLATLVLAWAVAGFCETAAVSQMGLLGMATLAVAALKGFQRRPVKGMAWTLGAAWLGTLVAVALLLSSPANGPRFAGSYQTPPNFLTAFVNTLSGTVLYFKLTFYWFPLTSLFTLLFFGMTAYLGLTVAQINPPSIKRIGLWGGGLLVVAYLWIAAAMFPSFFIESSFPSGRAQLTARWVVFLALAGTGLVLGLALRWLVVRKNWNGLPLTLALLGAGALSCVIVGLPSGTGPEPNYLEIRAFLVTYQWGAILGIAIAGLAVFALSRWAGQRFGRNFGMLLGLTALLLLQPVFVAKNVYADFSPLSDRATLWDLRDAQIRQLAQTEKNVTVHALDSLDGITELQDNPLHWVNRCAAWYYHLDSLRAIEPVLTLPNP